MLILDGMARVPASSITEARMARLRAALTVVTRNIDGTEERCAVEVADGEVRIPRGAWTLLRDAVPGEAVDASGLSDGAALIVPSMPSLRPYQEDAVAALLSRRQGVVVAPCGSGKTVLALAAIAREGRTALVLVHTKDLAVQWTERCMESLGVVAGLIGSGSDMRQPVTVALMQSLVRWDSEDIRTLGAAFGTVVVDECHHVPCDTMAFLLSNLRCRRRWGLTATPEREDGLGTMMRWIMGSVIHRIGHDGLRAGGHIVGVRMEKVGTGWTADLKEIAEEGAERRGWSADLWDGEAPIPSWVWSDMLALLAGDEDRNRLILDIACREILDGRTVLILARMRSHCVELAAGVRAAGLDAEALTAGRTRKARAAILDALRDGSLRCVVATSLADEGLDVPRLDRMILASPSRSSAAAEQRIGRILRPHPEKDSPVLYDLVDDVGPLRSQAAARWRVYRRILG